MGNDLNFDNYSPLKKISSGANATVYKATHDFLNRHVAIKIYNKQCPNDRRNKIMQGRLESQKLAQAEIPQVVDVYDAGIKDNKYFTIMEFFDSTTLRSWLVETKPNMASRTHLCRHILMQVFMLAEFELFHGDLHEDNIIIGKHYLADNLWWVQGESQCPDYRIIDFGTSAFNDKVFSVTRHWRLFHDTFKSLLFPFDIDLLHQESKPTHEKLLDLFEWYHSFIAAIPWFLSSLGHLHPLSYGRSPFNTNNTEQLSNILSAKPEFQLDSFMGNDYDWGTFDYVRHRNIHDQIQEEKPWKYNK